MPARAANELVAQFVLCTGLRLATALVCPVSQQSPVDTLAGLARKAIGMTWIGQNSRA